MPIEVADLPHLFLDLVCEVLDVVVVSVAEGGQVLVHLHFGALHPVDPLCVVAPQTGHLTLGLTQVPLHLLETARHVLHLSLEYQKRRNHYAILALSSMTTFNM